MAITNNQVDVAQFLLEHGADPKTADWWGRTPLWTAVEIRDRDMGEKWRATMDRAAALELIQAAGSRRRRKCTDQGSSSGAAVRSRLGICRGWISPARRRSCGRLYPAMLR